MANEINLTIKITEKGNLKIVGDKAERAAAGLDQTSKSARTADRNLKGAAQASANTTKNFSKMAQGISGGIVPAYATLAAQVFAVSAAFNFLKDAGQLELLKTGQTAYASATGISLRSLTKDIQAATDAQLGFRDAAQAAAIGTAAGLDPTQITNISKAAKDASTVLGRDLTDSFNRLVRGITKAEPELLDELGIILRLETATQNYADALGRNRESLTAFERSQAVANEVLTQAEEKYGKVLAVTGGSSNEFAQLSTAFEDIVNDLRSVAVDFLTPIATTLQKIPELIVLAFAPFAAQVIKTALPSLEKVGGALDKMAVKAEGASEKAQKSLKKALSNDEQVKQSAALQQTLRREVQENAKTRLKDVQANKNSLLQKLKDGKQLSNAQIAQVRKNLQNEARGYKIKDATIRGSLHKTLNEMERANKLTTKKMEGHFKAMAISVQGSFATIKTASAGLFASLVRGAQMAGAGISMALSAVSYIGLIVSLGALALAFFRSGKEAEDAGPKYDYLRSKVETLTTETDEFIQVQNILNDTFEDGNKAVEAYGKRLSNVSTQKLGETLKGSEELVRIQKEITGVIEQAQKDLPRAELMASPEMAQINQTFAMAVPDPAAGIAAMQRENEAHVELAETRKKSTFSLQDYLDAKKEELTDTENALKLLLDDKKALEGITNARFQASSVVQAYNASLDALEKGQKVDIDLMLQQRTNVEALAHSISELTRIQGENSRAIAAAESRVLPLGEYDVLLMNMNQELGLLKEIAAQYKIDATGRALTDQEKERIAFLEKRKSLIESLANLEQKVAVNNLAVDTALIKSSRGKTKLLRDSLKLEADIVKSQVKEFELTEKIRQANQLIGEDAEALAVAKQAQIDGTLSVEQQLLLDQNAARLRSIELAAMELGLTKEQTAELMLQKDAMFQIQQAALQAFETSFQGNLASLIKGEESSLSDAMVAIAQSTLGAVADTLAQQATEGLMEGIFGIKEDTPEERIKAGMLEAAERHGQIVRAAVEGENVSPLDKITGKDSGGTDGGGEKKGIMEKLFGTSTAATTGSGPGPQIGGNTTAKVGGSIPTFLQDFSDIFKTNTDDGFMKKLGTAFESGGQIFSDIFGSLGDLFGNIFGAGGGGGFMSFFGLANGGIVKGGFRSAAYANGGIARRPTIGLIGEGRYDEAVVPLPDGKSIPVSMPGGGMQQNNVTVNVAVDSEGNGSTEVESGQQGADLGRMVAAAVQRELINQKRAGGILNPMGVA
tara:strand:- start:1443 stop:5180 length:3738 start_codon:yes stop_codon:yes gene_type:complete